MNKKSTLQNFFTSAPNLSTINKLIAELESNKNTKALFTKYCITYKTKLVSMLMACKHVDEQLALLKLYMQISKTNFHKHKLMAKYSKSILLLAKNFARHSKPLLLDINKDNNIVFGFKVNTLFIDEVRMTAESFIYFNNNNIKLYTEKIYYINYVSIDSLIIESTKIRLIVKAMVFEIYTKDLSTSDMTKIENKCVMNDIRFVNSCKSNLTADRSVYGAACDKKDLSQITNNVSCQDTPKTVGNEDTKQISTNQDHFTSTSKKVEKKTSMPVDVAKNDCEVRTPKNTTGDTAIPQSKQIEKAFYNSPGSAVTEVKTTPYKKIIENININENINLKLLGNINSDRSPSTTSTKTLEESIDLPWKQNLNTLNNCTANNETENNQVSNHMLLNDNSSDDSNNRTETIKKDSIFEMSSDAEKPVAMDKDKMSNSKSLTFSFGFESENCKTTKIPKKHEHKKKIKYLKSINLSRKCKSKHKHDVKHIIDLKKQIFDELKNMYIKEEKKNLWRC